MFGVLIEVDTSGQPDRELSLKNLRENVVPRVKQAAGVQAGYWMRPLEDAKGTSMVIFDTEENARAMSQMVSVGSSPAEGVTVVRSEVREIVASI